MNPFKTVEEQAGSLLSQNEAIVQSLEVMRVDNENKQQSSIKAQNQIFVENPTREFMPESIQTKIERDSFVDEENLPLLDANEESKKAVQMSPIHLPAGFDTLNDRDIEFENTIKNSQHTNMKPKFTDENSNNESSVSFEGNTLPNTQVTPKTEQ